MNTRTTLMAVAAIVTVAERIVSNKRNKKNNFVKRANDNNMQEGFRQMNEFNNQMVIQQQMNNF